MPANVTLASEDTAQPDDEDDSGVETDQTLASGASTITDDLGSSDDNCKYSHNDEGNFDGLLYTVLDVFDLRAVYDDERNDSVSGLDDSQDCYSQSHDSSIQSILDLDENPEECERAGTCCTQEIEKDIIGTTFRRYLG